MPALHLYFVRFYVSSLSKTYSLFTCLHTTCLGGCTEQHPSIHVLARLWRRKIWPLYDHPRTGAARHPRTGAARHPRTGATHYGAAHHPRTGAARCAVRAQRAAPQLPTPIHHLSFRSPHCMPIRRFHGRIHCPPIIALKQPLSALPGKLLTKIRLSY